MKKLIILILAIAAGHVAFAQQKAKINYMTVSIYQQAGRISCMVVTRTDSAQVVKELKIKVRTASTQKELTDGDAALMQLLDPYYKRGWKLVSFGIDDSILNGNDYSKTFKYYLSNEGQ